MAGDFRQFVENPKELVERYRAMRRKTAELFDLILDSAYYLKPIALRNPIVFYEGHLPAFSVNTLAKRALGRPGINPELEIIFARGIDPDTENFTSSPEAAWPSRERTRLYATAADQLIEEILLTEDLWRPGHPFLHEAEAVFTILEHELMHQETLLYMFHQLPYDQKRRPAGYVSSDSKSAAQEVRAIEIPAGKATLGAERGGFGWDNEFGKTVVDVPAFEIDSRPVTNGEFLEFVDGGGYRSVELWTPSDWAWVSETGQNAPHFWRSEGSRWLWRGMFEEIPLRLSWPVWVSHAEAAAFVQWKGKRLPTEAEYHRAAYFDPASSERLYPWGADEPSSQRGNFDFANWDPTPAGGVPGGASAMGVRDLVGNGWEWTSTLFAPFPGFRPMATYPEYSADFFDDRHFVLKGASPVTPAPLVRRSFRNWFRPHYPYVYAKFRCVRTI